MQQKTRLAKKHISLYRNLVLLMVFILFVVMTLVYIIVATIAATKSSSWLEGLRGFIISFYPSIFIIPFAFLFGYIILRPVQESEREANEESMMQKMSAILLPALKTTVINAHQVSDSIQRMGIIEVNPRLDYDILKNRIGRSRERVYLSDNWLFLQNMNDFGEAFQQTALHNVSVRILLLNPTSSAAKQRSNDLYNDETHAVPLSKNTIEAFRRFKKKFQMENLEIRYHSLIPSAQIFLCDNQATVGMYFHGVDSQFCTQLEVMIKNENKEYTFLGKQIEAEFDIVWDSASIIPFDENVSNSA
jgi:hypothetical protein